VDAQNIMCSSVGNEQAGRRSVFTPLVKSSSIGSGDNWVGEL